MTSKCSDCKWYYTYTMEDLSASTSGHPENEAEKHECRKGIPQTYAYVENKKLSGWPDVTPDSWCGEFTVKHASPEEIIEILEKQQ
jgi:hypothetical protein